MAQLVKTVQGLAIASVKTAQGLAIASAKTIMGVDNTAGGGASAFVFSQTASGSDAGALASVNFGTAIPAGCLIYCYIKFEGTGSVSGITENGGGTFTLGTEPAPQEGGDLNCVAGWLLSATGGGTQIDIAYSGTCTFTRVICSRFTYGGTASKTADGQNSGINNGVGQGVVSTLVTNSGTFRLNIAGIGNYTGNAFDNPLIGGVTATFTPASQESDSWMFYNTEDLLVETASANYATSAPWVMSMNSFAAN